MIDNNPALDAFLEANPDIELRLPSEFGNKVLKSLGYPTRQRLEQIKRNRGGDSNPPGTPHPGPRPPRPLRQ